jgi:hypothetical protein
MGEAGRQESWDVSKSLRVESGAVRGFRDRSAPMRIVLSYAALAVAVIPAPLLALGVLPAYQVHARFLAFYTPFICLLTLAYLFYVRDHLSRIMLAPIRGPISERDDYYDPYRRRSAAESVRRHLGRAVTGLIVLLPALLLGVSFYCVTRYLTVLDQSVGVASALYGERFGAGEEVAFNRHPAGKPVPTRGQTAPFDTTTKAESVRPVGIPDSLPLPEDSGAVRTYVLRSSSIDSIPLFRELTILYIGAFGAACVAIVLMALKEHAKEAMGLSEQDLILRRATPGPE